MKNKIYNGTISGYYGTTSLIIIIKQLYTYNKSDKL